MNGIPLVVIEAKPPDGRGRSRMRSTAPPVLQPAWLVEIAEGNEQLFWTNQFTVATCFDEARAGTFSARPEHFLAWKDTVPVTIEELAESLGKPVEPLSSRRCWWRGCWPGALCWTSCGTSRCSCR